METEGMAETTQSADMLRSVFFVFHSICIPAYGWICWENSLQHLALVGVESQAGLYRVQTRLIHLLLYTHIRMRPGLGLPLESPSKLL